jgi:hypothetical protein
MFFSFICSGDTDTAVPLSGTRRSLAALGLPVKTSWYPWYIVSTEVSTENRRNYIPITKLYISLNPFGIYIYTHMLL